MSDKAKFYVDGFLGKRPGQTYMYMEDLYDLLREAELAVRQDASMDQKAAIAYKVLRETLQKMIG